MQNSIWVNLQLLQNDIQACLRLLTILTVLKILKQEGAVSCAHLCRAAQVLHIPFDGSTYASQPAQNSARLLFPTLSCCSESRTQI